MRLLVVDDHRLFRDGLKSLLAQWRPLAHLDEAGRLAEALEALQRPPPPVLVLLDLTLPDSPDPGATLRQASTMGRVAPVVAVTMADPGDLARQSAECGVRGFIRKSDPASVMLAALDIVLAGGSCIPADVLRREAALEASAPALSERQREVLGLLVQGLSNKEIARALGVAEATVKVHVHRILQVVGTSSRAKAAAWARQTGFLPA